VDKFRGVPPNVKLLLKMSTTTLYIRPSNSSDLIDLLSPQIPHSLFKEEGYDHREALFGIPPYGGSIAQNVYYADSDLCDPNVDTSSGYPSRPKSGGKMEPWQSPYILMVDRGACTFVKKVSVGDGIVCVVTRRRWTYRLYIGSRFEMRNAREHQV
jgi:hypothetical protein